MAQDDKQKQEQAMGQQVSINLDKTPILYTDSVMITSNEDGVIFDFCQRVGPGPQMRVVSRIGMSREHARKLLMALTGQMEREPGKVRTATKTVN